MTEAMLAVVQAAVGDAYRIDRELPAGGMSRLFLAEERSLGRSVVVKVLPGEHTSEVSAARFRREIEVTAHLQHPNVLTVLTAGVSDNLLFYVMPFVEGESLRKRLDREKQLPLADALRILQETASALAYAHSRGVVHRDIKPENILLQQGHAVVADFGIARALLEARSGTALTSTGVGIGTPGYMAPEQVGGDPTVDARADIYALGVVAYEMIGGLPPFTGTTAHAVIAAHLTAEARPLGDLRLDAPAHVVAAIHRALAKDPADRFQSADGFASAIAPATTPLPIAARRKTDRYLIGAIGTAAVVGLVLGVNALRSDAPDASNRTLLAIAPFNVIGEAPPVLRDGLVDLVSRSLDGAGDLRTVSASAILKGWNGTVDRETSRAFAQSNGAGLVVFGTVLTSATDSVQLRATVYDVVDSASLGDIVVSDLADRVDRLADSLSVAILRQLSKTRRIGTARLSALGTSSLLALKAFLRGEAFYRRGSWDSAFAAYSEAIAQDSNFAMAWSHGADSRGWEANSPLVVAWRLRAGTLARGLAPRDSIRVLLDSIGTAAAGRLPINDRIALRRRGTMMVEEARRRWPDDAEFLYLYGEWNVHNPGGIPSAPLATVVAAMERAVALDPDFVPVYLHLVQHRLTLDRDTTNALRHADQVLERRSDSIANAAPRAMLEILRGTAGDMRQIEHRLFTMQPPGAARAVMYALIMMLDDDQIGPKVSRMFVERAARGDSVSAFYLMLAAQALAARGHLNEAYSALRGSGPPELNAQLYALGIDQRVSPDSVVSRVLAATSQVTPLLDVLPWLARRGDTLAIARLEQAVSQRAGPPGSPEAQFGPLVTPAVRTFAALARNDTATAFRILQGTSDSVCVALCQEMQLIKAQLLRERGRHAEAKALLDLDWPELGRINYTMKMLELGRVAEAMNQREAAIDAYSYVVQGWGQGDSLAQRAARPAREGLRRLGADERVGRPVRR